MKAILIIYILSPLFAFGQSDVIWHDLTNELKSKSGGWAIGNACGTEPYMYVEFPEGLDMEGETLQVMHSHIVVMGELINQGELIYTCDKAILEIKGGALSVPEMDVNKALVYPNPFVSEIHIKNIEVRTLKLFDVTGRLLKDYVTVGQLHKIVVSDLKSGVYFLRINDFIAKKLVKL